MNSRMDQVRLCSIEQIMEGFTFEMSSFVVISIE